MSFWAKLGGYAMMVGGVAAAPYTGGASLALVPAGANVVAGDMKKDGAKKAADQLTAAGDKAIKTQETAAAEAKQAYSPYTQLGQVATGALGVGLGLQMPPPGSSGQPVNPPPLAAQVAMGHQPDADSEMTGGMSVPREAGATPQARAQIQTQSGYGGATLGRAAGMVQMQSPNGDVQFVPAGKALFYKSRGAQVIGEGGIA